MGGSSKRAPDPPDPIETAGAQTGLNVGTGIANQLLGQVNQNTPLGTLNYAQTGSTKWTDPLSGKVYDIPRMTATTTLTPQQQRLFNTQQQAGQNMATLARDQSQRLGSILGNPLDLGDAPDTRLTQMRTVGNDPRLQQNVKDAGKITRTYGTDFSADRQKVEDALMARMQPGMDQDRRELEAGLANRGIKLGSAAYDRAQGIAGQNVNDARLGAILGAGEEQSRLTGLEAARAQFQNAAQQQQYGQNLGNATFTNSARQQGFQNDLARLGFNNQVRQQNYGNSRQARNDWLQEQYAARNQPINEIGALLGTGQVQMPNFNVAGGPQVPTTDYGGMVGQNYNNQLQAWQARMAQNPMNGIMGGLFGLGQAGIMGL